MARADHTGHLLLICSAFFVYELACVAERAEGTDADRYLAALAQPTDPAACLGIEDPRLYGECVTMAIVAGLPPGPRGGSDSETALLGCGQIPEGPWRGECAFYVSDELGLRGEAAIAACDQAGELRSQCMGHAIAREAQAALREMSVGAELDTLPAVELITSRYLGKGPDSRSRAQQLLIAAVSQREPGAPFSLKLCGALDAPSCEAAFRQRTEVAALKLRPSDREPWRIACAHSVSVERATSLGLPAWTPDFDTTAASVWTDLCRR